MTSPTGNRRIPSESSPESGHLKRTRLQGNQKRRKARHINSVPESLRDFRNLCWDEPNHPGARKTRQRPAVRAAQERRLALPPPEGLEKNPLPMNAADKAVTPRPNAYSASAFAAYRSMCRKQLHYMGF